MSAYDTIAAPATAPGAADAAIIRIAGPSALDFAKEYFFPEPPVDRFAFYDGDLRIPQGAVPCRVFIMPAPRSYTRDHTVELHIPGAPVLIRFILELCYQYGIREPEPGEFTRRAFLNGRIRLIEAMGVMEMISAAGREQLQGARNMLMGGTAQTLEAIRDNARELAARIELDIDFSQDEVSVFSDVSHFHQELDALIQQVNHLLSGGTVRRAVSGESHIIVTGLVNAGKSTLANQLLGFKRSRVASIAGTTRDMVQGRIEREEGTCLIYDSPGFTSSPDIFEEKARSIMQESGFNAMFMLLVVSTVDPLPRSLQELFLAHPGPDHTIVIASKKDLARPEAVLNNPAFKKCRDCIAVSEKDPDSIRKVEDALFAMVSEARSGETFVLPGMAARVLDECLHILQQLREKGDPHTYPELTAEELREVERLTGQFGYDRPGDQLLNTIFNGFCIGK